MSLLFLICGVHSKDSNPAVISPAANPDRVETVKGYTMKEISLHTNEDSIWIVIDNNVYDVTRYSDHPGGKRILLTNAGKDATAQFMAIHSEYVLDMLKNFHIGRVIIDIATTEAAHDATHSVGSSKGNIVPFVIQQKIQVNHNTYRLFMKSSAAGNASFPLPVGNHVLFHFKSGNQSFTRPYTPITYSSETGDMELIIKTYPKVEGKLSSSPMIEAARVGDFIKIEGPKGRITYSESGVITFDQTQLKVKRMVFLCGGTGIAPVYRVLVAAVENIEDETVMEVMYSNRTEEDILLRSELDELVSKSCGRLKIHYILSSPSQTGWSHLSGRVTVDIVRDHLAAPDDDTLALLCGPPGFEETCVSALLECGYSSERVLRF